MKRVQAKTRIHLQWIGNYPNDYAEKTRYRDHLWGEAQCPPEEESHMTVAQLKHLRSVCRGLYRVTPYYNAAELVQTEEENLFREKYQAWKPEDVIQKTRGILEPLWGEIDVSHKRGQYRIYVKKINSTIGPVQRLHLLKALEAMERGEKMTAAFHMGVL